MYRLNLSFMRIFNSTISCNSQLPPTNHRIQPPRLESLDLVTDSVGAIASQTPVLAVLSALIIHFPRLPESCHFEPSSNLKPTLPFLNTNLLLLQLHDSRMFRPLIEIFQRPPDVIFLPLDLPRYLPVRCVFHPARQPVRGCCLSGEVAEADALDFAVDEE